METWIDRAKEFSSEDRDDEEYHLNQAETEESRDEPDEILVFDLGFDNNEGLLHAAFEQSGEGKVEWPSGILATLSYSPDSKNKVPLPDLYRKEWMGKIGIPDLTFSQNGWISAMISIHSARIITTSTCHLVF